MSDRAIRADPCAATVLLLQSLTNRRADPDQAWFWAPDWLSGELEADLEAPSDPGSVYNDVESFKAVLHAARSE